MISNEAVRTSHSRKFQSVDEVRILRPLRDQLRSNLSVRITRYILRVLCLPNSCNRMYVPDQYFSDASCFKVPYNCPSIVATDRLKQHKISRSIKLVDICILPNNVPLLLNAEHVAIPSSRLSSMRSGRAFRTYGSLNNFNNRQKINTAV